MPTPPWCCTTTPTTSGSQRSPGNLMSGSSRKEPGTGSERQAHNDGVPELAVASAVVAAEQALALEAEPPPWRFDACNLHVVGNGPPPGWTTAPPPRGGKGRPRP